MCLLSFSDQWVWGTSLEPYPNHISKISTWLVINWGVAWVDKFICAWIAPQGTIKHHHYDKPLLNSTHSSFVHESHHKVQYHTIPPYDQYDQYEKPLLNLTYSFFHFCAFLIYHLTSFLSISNFFAPLCREHCAVKIIDTRKFALTPGLSPKELREEVILIYLVLLHHVLLCHIYPYLTLFVP